MIYKMEFDQQTLATITQILRTAPVGYNIVAPILAQIDRQVIEQTKERQQAHLKAVE